MIVSARVLSNGGVLAGNKLMSGSTGGARCYVRPPLKTGLKVGSAAGDLCSQHWLIKSR